MAAKELRFNGDARARMLHGIDILANAVKVTLGPKGHQRPPQQILRRPRITKDRVTVAKEIELSDKFENMECPDGQGGCHGPAIRPATAPTTAATVLGEAIVREGDQSGRRWDQPDGFAARDRHGRCIQSSSMTWKKGSKKISTNAEIAQIGTISANDDREVGAEMIAQAMHKVGNEGRALTIEEATSLETGLDIVSGAVQFDRGYLSPYFVTNAEKMLCELDKPYIILFEEEAVQSPGDPPRARSGSEERQSALDRRRGHRGRGAGDARRQQIARRAQGGGGEGAGLWRSAQIP